MLQYVMPQLVKSLVVAAERHHVGAQRCLCFLPSSADAASSSSSSSSAAVAAPPQVRTGTARALSSNMRELAAGTRAAGFSYKRGDFRRISAAGAAQCRAAGG